MNKKSRVARFTKTMGKLSAALGPGESGHVLVRGKPAGRFIREATRQRRRKFNIWGRLQQEKYSKQDGQRLIDIIIKSQ